MRFRIRLTWIVFLACLIVVCAAMIWMSATTLRLEKSEYLAEQQAERERLALWRMDSAMVPLISRESTRLHRDYQQNAPPPFPDDGKPSSFSRTEERHAFLRKSEFPYILFHFQFEPSGRLISPQVDNETGKDPVLPSPGKMSGQNLTKKLLAEFDKKITRRQLQKALSVEETPPISEEPDSNQNALMQGPSQQMFPNPPAQISQSYSQRAAQNRVMRNSTEFQKRLETFNNVNGAEFAQRGILTTSSHKGLETGSMKAIWLNGTLLLARETRIMGQQYIQGCVLDWSEIRKWLRREIADLLPNADLVPESASTQSGNHLLLASLPVRLIPGPANVDLPVGWTPMQFSLMIAWICIGLAAVAVAILLLMTVRLSERRGAFVSAVTHELRTPLTTFRMYTDMLVNDMVSDDSQRKQYLETISREAERLGHLVENVLLYARLDSPRKQSIRENVSLNSLLQRLQDSLGRRTQQAEMELVVSLSETPNEVPQADAAGIERIVVNLVDNACKYAVNTEDRRVLVDVFTESDEAVLRVRDFGPGLSEREQKRMFQPFSKSDREAANSAPGVGLGLSLCRQLARSMGGRLLFKNDVSPGACFELRLPANKV
ncbi:MAG: hypothetical protein Tsb009_31880 [Planctomycetaceae bacterium]